MRRTSANEEFVMRLESETSCVDRSLNTFVERGKVKRDKLFAPVPCREYRIRLSYVFKSLYRNSRGCGPAMVDDVAQAPAVH